RRHTRSKRDWSSDVCSSDLSCSDMSSFVGSTPNAATAVRHPKQANAARTSINWSRTAENRGLDCLLFSLALVQAAVRLKLLISRSEERRVGKAVGTSEEDEG